ncbi:glutamate receptor ionotropic, kainate 2-like isoform X2 [Littorina saxatilis]|uniref:glutamate receptor ionotropic, kainate 2-like isoform X2 n=1 Tax=Littorina saxatilis TaxID=31220 RepID=UPI0038B68066
MEWTTKVICFVLLTWSAATAYKHTITASVLGYPGSTAEEMYEKIADVTMEESMSARQRENCDIRFNSLTFNTTTGSDVYDSLTKARENFSQKSIAAAIGPFIDVFASTEYVILNQYHLLTSAAGQNAELMDLKKVVSILPEPKSMARAIADVITKLHWRNVAFLSQDDFSPVLQLGQNDIQVWPIRLPTHITSHTDRDLQRNLIELRTSEKHKFILHSSRRDTVRHVMTAAKQLHLLHHTIDWFVTYPDFEDVIQEGEWPGSLYGLSLLNHEKIPGNITYFLQHNMSRLDLGLAVDVVGLMRHVLLISSDDCQTAPQGNQREVMAEEFKFHLKNRRRTYTGALGEYVWGRDNNTRTNYTMDVLAFKAGKMDTIGSVDFMDGRPEVSMTHEPSVNPAPSTVFSKDIELTIVTTQTDPFIIKRGENEYTGFSYDLLKALTEKLEFRFKLSDVTGAENGDEALVRELQKGTASMAVGALEVTAARETVISFSYTILSTQASLLIKKAESTQNFFQFLSPFKMNLWLMIVAFIAVAAIALFLISRYDPTQQAAMEQRFDLKESIWYALNILLQGTTDYSPNTTAMRAIIAFFWFSVIIIEAAYTANLAAYLTLQQMDNRIKTVHDLAGQTQVKYGVKNNSNLMEYFKEQKEDPFERMWAFMKINEGYSLLSNTTQIIEKVMSGSFAFIDDGVTNDYYATQYCGIEAIDQNFGAKDYSFGFPRGAPYRDDINRALLQLKEEGVLDELKEKWWSAGKNCTEDDDTRSVTDQTTAELDIANMVGVFIVLAAFVVLAIGVDIGERVYRCRRAEEEEKGEPVVTEDGVLHNQYAEYS